MMVEATKTQRTKQISANSSRMPNAASSAPAATAVPAGPAKFRFMLSLEVLRQASSGPTPVRSINNKPNGIFTLLKNGAPTLMRDPVNHSEKTGNNVPDKTATQATSSTRLLNKKLDSRDTRES